MDTEFLVETSTSAPRALMLFGHRYLFGKHFFTSFSFPTPNSPSPSAPFSKSDNFHAKATQTSLQGNSGVSRNEMPKRATEAGKTMKSIISTFLISSYISFLFPQSLSFSAT